MKHLKPYKIFESKDKINHELIQNLKDISLDLLDDYPNLQLVYRVDIGSDKALRGLFVPSEVSSEWYSPKIDRYDGRLSYSFTFSEVGDEDVYNTTFHLTFEPGYDYDGGDTYYPDENDVDHAIDNSMLDTANSYYVSELSRNIHKTVFVIEVNNEETDDYMPGEDDIEHAMEYSGCIDEWNSFSAKYIPKDIPSVVDGKQKEILSRIIQMYPNETINLI